MQCYQMEDRCGDFVRYVGCSNSGSRGERVKSGADVSAGTATVRRCWGKGR